MKPYLLAALVVVMSLVSVAVTVLGIVLLIKVAIHVW